MYRIIISSSSSSSTGHWGSSCCIDSSATWVPKKYRPPRNYQFSIPPIMFGSGWEVGFWKGREKESWGWALPQFCFIVSFCNFFALHYESQTMYVYQNEEPPGESQAHVPNFGESSSVGFTWHAAQNVTSHSKNRKSQPEMEFLPTFLEDNSVL